MKTIGVLVQSLTIEYSLSIINGITDYFRNKDVKVVIAQVKGPHYHLGTHEYQEWTSTSSVFSQQVDGIIILTGSFNATISKDKLESFLKDFPSKPIVSINTSLALENSSSVLIENASAYEKLITHMVKVHKCKKFAYLGPFPEKSEEAKDRYDCFINALKKNKIEFDSNLFIPGTYSKTDAENTFRELYHKKSDVNFDCLVSANDLMAIGAKDILTSIGVRVPEHVKIIGYDNTSHSNVTIPALTTIDQNCYGQGTEAAELIYKKCYGKNVPAESRVYAQLFIKESCGCSNSKKHNTVDNQAIKITQLVSNGELSHFLSKLSNLSVIIDICKANYTSQQLFYTLKYMIENAKLESIAVCRYEDPIIHGRKDPFTLPQKIILSMYIDNKRGIEEFEKGVSFNPNEYILPSEYFTEENGNYMLFPIYSGEYNYGYIVCKLASDDLAVTMIALRIIVSSISQAYEYTNRISENKQLYQENKELQKNNTTLSKQSKTDELTRLLNRRGFMELGQNHIDLAREDGDSGLVFFADLDGLKTINDKYGHKMGDAAIKCVGSILSQILRANDVVGRLSGDEFAAIATGMSENLIPKVRKQATELCKELTQEHNFPFDLSFSIGYSKFDAGNSALQLLLEQADKVMYEEKKIRHQSRNQ